MLNAIACWHAMDIRTNATYARTSRSGLPSHVCEKKKRNERKQQPYRRGDDDTKIWVMAVALARHSRKRAHPRCILSRAFHFNAIIFAAGDWRFNLDPRAHNLEAAFQQKTTSEKDTRIFAVVREEPVNACECGNEAPRAGEP